MQRGGRVVFDVFIRGDQIVAERGGEALGNIAAVAAPRLIDDHAVSPQTFDFAQYSTFVWKIPAGRCACARGVLQ